MILGSAATPFDSDSARQIADRYQLGKRMRRALRLLDSPRLHRVLRSHLDESVEWEDIKERDNLDELLACLSVLHIAGLDQPQDFEQLGFPPTEILALLQHPVVARYFEDHYPYAPPVLVREMIRDDVPADYLIALADERHSDGWSSAFRQFLVLDSAFNAAGPLELFLAVLDDYIIDDLDLVDLRKAFRREESMRDLLRKKTGRGLLEGLQDFLEFSDELDDFLAGCRPYPLFAGLVWLNYGYWYGAGGERMRKVADWVTDMLRTMATRPVANVPVDIETARRLQATMARLTDLEAYPHSILAACEQPLQRWRRNVARRRASVRGEG